VKSGSSKRKLGIVEVVVLMGFWLFSVRISLSHLSLFVPLSPHKREREREREGERVLVI
jgi:hypothetical protein